MVYFILWQILIYTPMPWNLKIIIALVSNIFAPASARKPMLLALLFAVVLSIFSVPSFTFNSVMPHEGSTAFIYKISNNKADCYVSGQKFKIKSKALSHFKDGDAVILNKIEIRHQDTHNIHAFDYERHYQIKGYIGYISADLAPAKIATVDVWYRRFLSSIRRYVLDVFSGYRIETQRLARSLILGDLGDKQLTEMISSLGIIHLFVISGFHFSVVSMLVFGVLHKLLRWPYKIAQVILCSVLILYYLVIFGGYGSQRALFMVIFGFVAFLFNLRKDTIQLTLFYAACSLAINPQCFNELGFILTNITVIVVSVVSRRLKHVNLSKTQQNLILSFAVFLVISSLIIYQNGQICLAAVLLVPLLTPVISVFIIAIVVNLALPFLSSFPLFLKGLDLLSRVIYGWIDKAYQIRHLTLKAHPQIALIILIIMCLYAVLRLLQNQGVTKLHSIMISVFVSAVVMISTINTGITIKSYALYDGEAYLIRSSSSVIIYDVGNDPNIINYLKKDGVDVIDLIVISHSDQDHIGMLDEIIKQFEVKEVLLETESQTKRQVGAFNLKFFYREIHSDSPKNDSSISMLLSYNQHSMLFTGDLEQAGGLALLEEFSEAVDILKVPHHGSYNPVFEEMLEVYQPSVCFISGGKGKGIDKSKIYASLTSHDQLFYDTMEDGEVTIDLSGDLIEFITYNERRTDGLRFILSGH